MVARTTRSRDTSKFDSLARKQEMLAGDMCGYVSSESISTP